MIVRARFRSVQGILLAVLAMAASSGLAQQNLAQQDNASESQSRLNEGEQGREQGGTEDAQGQTDPVLAETEADAQPHPADVEAPTDGAQVISGMSVLGNQETPTSLVIVPWKSSEIGDSVGVSTMLDDSRQPVDREVFMRALSYYEIRSEESQ